MMDFFIIYKDGAKEVVKAESLSDVQIYVLKNRDKVSVISPIMEECKKLAASYNIKVIA